MVHDLGTWLGALDLVPKRFRGDNNKMKMKIIILSVGIWI
jgi:hypothetical protein